MLFRAAISTHVSCSENYTHRYQLLGTGGYQPEVEESLQKKEVKVFVTSMSIKQVAAMGITSSAFAISFGIYAYLNLKIKFVSWSRNKTQAVLTYNVQVSAQVSFCVGNGTHIGTSWWL